MGGTAARLSPVFSWVTVDEMQHATTTGADRRAKTPISRWVGTVGGIAAFNAGDENIVKRTIARGVLALAVVFGVFPSELGPGARETIAASSKFFAAQAAGEAGAARVWLALAGIAEGRPLQRGDVLAEEWRKTANDELAHCVAFARLARARLGPRTGDAGRLKARPERETRIN